MKKNLFFVVMLGVAIISMSCAKKISKADIEFQVGQAVSEYFEDILSENPTYGSFMGIDRFETKVTLIKEAENRYSGDAVIEMWKNDEHGGDGPGTKLGEEKNSITVIVDPDDGSFRWEMEN